GGSDEAEFDHGAEGADEAGVGGAAGGGELRRVAGHVADGGGDHVSEGAWRGQEGLAADLRGHRDRALEAVGGGPGLALDPGGERGAGVVRVEADVEAGL